ncbi:MAG: hypothetical protein QOD77_76 [Thermoplasmata archaeon]|nr:hypothetical protein [Thermoplasmata archaeon]
MEVSLSGTGGKLRDALVKVVLGLLLTAFALVPALYVHDYLRVVSTIIFVGLVLVVARVYLAAFATFRRRPAPPPKPDGVAWPTVSVLVVAYNEGAVLPRTIASMERVDYPHDRIRFVYVYEKRSTDLTGPLIQAAARKDARFVAVERDDKRGGKAAACNFGLSQCTGEILVSLDADHELEPGAVKRAVQHFLANPGVVCVKGRAVGINQHESVLAALTKLERDVIERGDIYMRDVVGGFTFFGGGQAFFRREVFQRLGAFDEEILVEDIDFSIKIHEAGGQILVDPEIRTLEENPAQLSAWWAQRRRWGRGWMQVTKRYIGRVHGMEHVHLGAKLDLYHTLAYVLVPIVFLLSPALFLLGQMGVDTSTFIPGDMWGWTVFSAAPFVAWLCMWLQDRRDGVRHDLREWLALPLLGPYMMFQTLTFWSAFLDEFVLKKPSVYVKTTKTGNLQKPAVPTPVLDVADE